MGYFKKCLFSFVLLNVIYNWNVKAGLTDQDLTLTSREKQSLEKLLKNMEGSITQDYMKSDIYLIKWLRAGDLDLKKAERKLRSHLNWRKEYKVDSITKEDFSILEQNYPVDIEGVAYNGSPILALDAEDWDVRKAVLAGQEETLYRYLISRMEIVISKVREAQEKGQKVTRFYVIDNLKGFNLIQHACLQCMPVHIRFISSFSAQYPGMVEQSVYINAPSSIEFVIRVLQPVASKENQNSTKIFGINKQEWQEYLFKLISPDQLTEDFGGNRKQ